MKKIWNRVFALMLSVVMVISAITVVPVKAENKEKIVYVTIEKFTIGQGFAMTPTKVSITENMTVTDAVNKAAKAEGVDLVYTDSGYGAYLSGIKNADNGKVNIPQAISSMGTFESWGMSYPAPTNENVRKNTNKDGLLSEYTYTDMAGWLYSVNNESLSASASETIAKDGDVIRVQFSIYGWGLDLGNPDFSTGEKKISLANKDELIKLVANIKGNIKSTNKNTIQKEYDSAIKVLEEYEAQQGDVDSTTKSVEKAYADSLKPQKQQKSRKVGKPKIKRAVRDIFHEKRANIKIEIKKVAKAKGYQIRIYRTEENAKKNKKAIVKKTFKKNKKYLKVYSKKFKKISGYYVKVRAYRKIKGKTYYGLWTNPTMVLTCK